MRIPSLIVLLFLVVLCWSYGRWSLPPREAPPALLRSGGTAVTVVLANGAESGVYQFYDAANRGSVICLTDRTLSLQTLHLLDSQRPLADGERFELSPEKRAVVRGWMSASDRMLLGIPLHPDRMTRSDWESLPGIGPKLATAIELDRQKNGDFGALSTLKRVKGVGPKKLEAWKPYFDPERGVNLK